MSKRENRPYKMVKDPISGEKRKVSVKDSEVKAKIMEAFNLKTDQEYRRFYDIQKNKVNTYNEFTKADKKDAPKIQSVQSFLYSQAKSRLKYGQDYEPSAQTKLVNSMPAYSITKGRNVHEKMHSQQHKDVQMRFAASMLKNMEHFMAAYQGTEKNPSILDKIKEKYKDDPAKMMGAIAAYAESLKEVKKNAKGEYVKSESGFPLGSTAGSPSATKFKYGEDEFSQ